MTVVASSYAREKNDLYQTEPFATLALLRHFPLKAGDIAWEAAAGNHLMADVMRETGAMVITSDIAVYDRHHDMTYDFLQEPVHNVAWATHLYTNPPYGKGNRDAVRFARLALERCSGWVALLLTAKFDFGKTRADLFGNNPRFHAKIALTDRIQWFPGDSTGTEDHCWMVWRPADAPYENPIIIYAGNSKEPTS